MKKVLVFGGTRFFGEKAVEKMLTKNWEVTIATRGKTPHSFGDKVDHVTLDRSDESHEGWQKISSVQWDAVFDNICFTKEDAQLAIDKLSGKANYYLMTSSLAVYDGEQDGFKETDFSAESFTIDPNTEVTYGEGKRQAEAHLTQHSPFKLGTLRIPIVLGDDDYTERLLYYVEKAHQKEPIVLNEAEAKISFIDAEDAAEVIVWMIEHEKSGPYNASSRDNVTIKELMRWVAEGTGETLDLSYESTVEKPSPFSISKHWYLNVDKITDEGFVLPNLSDWMKPLIQRLSDQVKKG